jgi:iron-sulfur cluster repair protein YtfE (RIC family)
MNIDLRETNKHDPLKRMVEKQTEQEEMSPMDPPDAYSPPAKDSIPFDEMHPCLQGFVLEHERCKEELTKLETTLESIRTNGPSKESNHALSDFFVFLDEGILVHNQKEEKILFPLLQERLMEHGDHSNGPVAHTAIDALEDDHTKLMQIAAVAFNLISMSSRLPDRNSGIMVLDAGLEQGNTLVEMLRLHIFREDNAVFPLAQKYLSNAELDEMKVRFDNWK